MGYEVVDGWWVRDGRRARIVDMMSTNGSTINYRIDCDDGDGVASVKRISLADAMKVVTQFLQPKCVVRVTTDDGNSWVTSINTDFAGAVKYFRGAGGFENSDGSVSKVASVCEVCDG
jgi:hypothetical protein